MREGLFDVTYPTRAQCGLVGATANAAGTNGLTPSEARKS
jgi:hypothetical protein